MWFVLGISAFVLLVMLEGKRQEKKYGKASGKPSLMGVGMLELQRHLQADRKVEVIQKRQRDDPGEVEDQGSGDGEAGGARPR